MAKRLFKQHIYTVREVNIGDPQNSFGKYQETANEDQAFLERELDVLPICKHGHVIRNQQEIGGTCICGALLCQACAQVRCELDGHVLCKEHTLNVEGKTLCSTHGFFRVMAAMLLEWS